MRREPTSEEIYRRWEQLARIETSAESPDGYIAARTDVRGRLLELTLDPRIYRQPQATDLAATISEVVAESKRLARQQAFAVLAPLLPATASAEDCDLAVGPLLTEIDRRKQAERR
jgi:hypothetical protein